MRSCAAQGCCTSHCRDAMISATRSRRAQHVALLDPALRTEFARTVTVRQQHRDGRLSAIARPSRDSAAAPVRNGRPIRRSHAARSRSETGHRRRACRAARASVALPSGNVDLMRRRQRRCGFRAQQVTANSVRKPMADRRRIGLPGRSWCWKDSAPLLETLPCAKAAIHHKSVGLTGGHHDLFMIDSHRNTSIRSVRDRSSRSSTC